MPCWLKDPDLFMENWNDRICIWRLNNKVATPLFPHHFSLETNISKRSADHLSFVDHSFAWKRSDFDALIAFLNSHDIFVNCQGLVITTTFPRENASGHQPNMSRIVRFWSQDVLNLGLYGLPVLRVPFREVRYIDVGGSALVELSTSQENELAKREAKENELATQLAVCIKERDREKAEKEAVEAEVSSLKSKYYLFNQKNI